MDLQALRHCPEFEPRSNKGPVGLKIHSLSLGKIQLDSKILHNCQHPHVQGLVAQKRWLHIAPNALPGRLALSRRLTDRPIRHIRHNDRNSEWNSATLAVVTTRLVLEPGRCAQTSVGRYLCSLARIHHQEALPLARRDLESRIWEQEPPRAH